MTDEQLNQEASAFKTQMRFTQQPIMLDDSLEQEEAEDPLTFPEHLNTIGDIDIVEPPRFGISLWNVRGRVDSALPRTNNALEAFHGSFRVL